MKFYDNGNSVSINLRPRKQILYRIEGIDFKEYEILSAYPTNGFWVMDNGKRTYIRNRKTKQTELFVVKDAAILAYTTKLAICYSSISQYRNCLIGGGLIFARYENFKFEFECFNYGEFEQTKKGWKTKNRYYYQDSHNRPLRIDGQGRFAMYVGNATGAQTFVDEIIILELAALQKAEQKFTEKYLTDKLSG